MAAQRLWVAGLSWLLVGCKGSDGISPPLPPCTSGTPLALAVGAYQSIDPGPVSGCIVFPASVSATEYLLVPQAATGTPNESASFRLVGSALAPSALANLVAAPAAPPAELSPADRFHLFLRQAERTRSYPAPSRAGGATARELASLTPITITPVDSGNVRSFKVCGDLRCDTLLTVTASALKVGQHIAIYVDNGAPQPGLSQTDLDGMRDVFDNRLYAIDHAAFGTESDIDSNAVVIVLMTNRVNQLVDSLECRASIVAGYFFGADIDPFWRSRYNNAEIFYAMVPDQANTLKSCARSVSLVKRSVPVTFVHEFQHMISYNQHVLVRKGDPEILWLNEALSQYAEERGGRSYLPADTTTFCDYVVGDLTNSGEYLTAPASHFLVDTSGIGALEERGAYWLFARYIIDQFAADTSLAAADAFTSTLDQTALTGVANVAQQAGNTPFATLVTRWVLANYVSDLPVFTAAGELQYKKWAFRTDYATLRARCGNGNIQGSFPLVPDSGDGSAVDLTGVLRAGSGSYFRAQQAAGAAQFGLLFSNAAGGALRGSLVPRLNVIRIQ